MDLLADGPEDAAVRLVLAHGAGAPMDSPLLSGLARALASQGVRVVRFEFPYMAARRTGQRRPPDRTSVLLDTWRTVLKELGGGPSFMGGHSMGGRMASMIADEAGARGLICVSYPFHPPKEPDNLRVAHLKDLRTPALFLQGTRDPFGSPSEVSGYGLSLAIQIHWLEGADHSLKGAVRQGRGLQAQIAAAAQAALAFMQLH